MSPFYTHTHPYCQEFPARWTKMEFYAHTTLDTMANHLPHLRRRRLGGTHIIHSGVHICSSHISTCVYVVSQWGGSRLREESYWKPKPKSPLQLPRSWSREKYKYVHSLRQRHAIVHKLLAWGSQGIHKGSCKPKKTGDIVPRQYRRVYTQLIALESTVYGPEWRLLTCPSHI